ncbi:aminotransferase class I/II-fold pyridoxal phosphate-dependent enzyme, partial [Azospirillum brasilense]|uniref:aminotransferase class I/II-fold pyridoxal phosphate-dependent enzyme n=1 Tax=Azospirillum brasilense TaxID=192 RepID=UPI001FFF95BA
SGPQGALRGRAGPTCGVGGQTRRGWVYRGGGVEGWAERRGGSRRRGCLALEALGSVPGLRCLKPEAGMFMLVDVRGTGLPTMEFAWRLFRETGVSVLDAGAFGPAAAGCVRLSFAVGEAELAEACRRIAAFVTGLA